MCLVGCVMLSASEALPGFHKIRFRETQKVCGNVYFCICQCFSCLFCSTEHHTCFTQVCHSDLCLICLCSTLFIFDIYPVSRMLLSLEIIGCRSGHSVQTSSAVIEENASYCRISREFTAHVCFMTPTSKKASKQVGVNAYTVICIRRPFTS